MGDFSKIRIFFSKWSSADYPLILEKTAHFEKKIRIKGKMTQIENIFRAIFVSS